MNSSKPRVAEARQIPSLKVHDFDLQNVYMAGEFATFRKRGDATDFTSNALNYYNSMRKNIVTPNGFNPTESDIPLDQWSPDNVYGAKGLPQSG